MDRRAFASAALAAALLSGSGTAIPAAAGPNAAPASSRRPRASGAEVSIGMLLYPGMTALDVVGPRELLAGLAGEHLHLVAKQAGPVMSDTGLSIVATHDFTGCPRDLTVLFVPGGDGTPAQMRDAETLAFLRERAARAAWVTSVCTGSLVLGAAGLLEGYRATSHWCVRECVLPLLGATPVDERVVFDRNRVTAAGISAGLDFALALAARLSDDTEARTAQLVAEYAPQPPFGAGTPETAGPDIVRIAGTRLSDLVAGSLRAASERG